MSYDEEAASAVYRQRRRQQEPVGSSRAQQAREQAGVLLAEAARLDENHVEEPKFDDGTAVIMFTKRHHNSDTDYTYAGVRVIISGCGRWFVSGSMEMNARMGYTWEQVLDFIQRGVDNWCIWFPTEMVVLAGSPTEES